MAKSLTPFSNAPALTQAEKVELFTAASAGGEAQYKQKLATAAMVPIVISMIENSFARKTFHVDHIDGTVQMYTMKRRMKPVRLQKYGATPTFTYEYPYIYVKPEVISVKPRIQLQTIMDAQFDAAADILNDAGLEMAVKEDSMFLSLLATAAPTGATTTSNVIPNVIAGPYGQGHLFDQNNYRVGSSNAAPEGGKAGDPSKRDFLVAMGLLRDIGYRPDATLMNPTDQGLLSSQNDFSLYMNWGLREVQETGVVSNPWGLKTVLSPLVPRATTYIFDTAELARIVEREGITVRPNVVDLFQEWLVYERISPFIRNANAVISLSWYSSL